jgi:hypothetical protein
MREKLVMGEKNVSRVLNKQISLSEMLFTIYAGIPPPLSDKSKK